MNDAGHVVGVVAENKDGETLYFGARKGVILASGGYEWNKELVKAFLKMPITHPVSPPGNEGDALMMAMEAGAALENMSEAWWYPAMVDPTFEYEDQVMAQLGGGRNVTVRTLLSSINMGAVSFMKGQLTTICRVPSLSMIQ